MRERLLADITFVGPLIVMQPHVQLQVVLSSKHFIADRTLPVLLSADPLVHVVLQLSEDKEGLVAVGAEEPLGQVGPGVSSQAGQVGAAHAALAARVLRVQLQLVHLVVVLIQQRPFFERGIAEFTRECLLVAVLGPERNLPDR